ncbi:hypothetical protein QIW53_13520 [Pseudomonas fluorescens]
MDITLQGRAISLHPLQYHDADALVRAAARWSQAQFGALQHH